MSPNECDSHPCMAYMFYIIIASFLSCTPEFQVDQSLANPVLDYRGSGHETVTVHWPIL